MTADLPRAFPALSGRRLPALVTLSRRLASPARTQAFDFASLRAG